MLSIIPFLIRTLPRNAGPLDPSTIVAFTKTTGRVWANIVVDKTSVPANTKTKINVARVSMFMVIERIMKRAFCVHRGENGIEPFHKKANVGYAYLGGKSHIE
jgi:hypothetical protein